MATISVEDSTGAAQTIQQPLPPGAAAPSASLPVTPSNPPIGASNWACANSSITGNNQAVLSARTGVSGTGATKRVLTNTSSSITMWLWNASTGGGVSTGYGLAPGQSIVFNHTAAVWGSVSAACTFQYYEEY